MIKVTKKKGVLSVFYIHKSNNYQGSRNSILFQLAMSYLLIIATSYIVVNVLMISVIINKVNMFYFYISLNQYGL